MTEYTRVKAADGSPVARSEAEQSAEKFPRALAQRGGSMPPGMRWNERRGFYYPGRMTLAEAIERRVTREIQQELIRLEMPPALAALQAKLDRVMR
jgi:hypothetical protein